MSWGGLLRQPPIGCFVLCAIHSFFIDILLRFILIIIYVILIVIRCLEMRKVWFFCPRSVGLVLAERGRARLSRDAIASDRLALDWIDRLCSTALGGAIEDKASVRGREAGARFQRQAMPLVGS